MCISEWHKRGGLVGLVRPSGPWRYAAIPGPNSPRRLGRRKCGRLPVRQLLVGPSLSPGRGTYMYTDRKMWKRVGQTRLIEKPSDRVQTEEKHTNCPRAEAAIRPRWDQAAENTSPTSPEGLFTWPVGRLTG
ncbi:unnamed protein product [Protopolystoma xenopodis]|uniref:Uncharacterized protein n=1 Tax=Protopolystoma xenopodis TaxID=117903 RepID=A0A448XBQ9_9PLAT|nr:unnamed protein product [Protopolystoma xenopodis]